MKKIIKKTTISVLILTFIFSPVNFNHFGENSARGSGFELITEDTTWSGNIIVDKVIGIDNEATLTIEKGTVVEFDSEDDIYSYAGIIVGKGKIVAVGTENDPVIFKRKESDDYFSLIFGPGVDMQNPQSFFRYVSTEGGGFSANSPEEPPVMTYNSKQKNSVVSVAIAQTSPSNLGAISVQGGGSIHVENSKIINSRYAGVYASGGKAEIVNSNFDDNNDNTAVISDLYNENDLLLRNNWYGSDVMQENLFAPKHCELNEEVCEPDLEGEVIRGKAKIDTWKLNDIIIDPAIIVPGILGSAFNREGEMKLDPIWHKYDDLEESLNRNIYGPSYKMTNGYGKLIFPFPYNWRIKNEDTAILLKNKIKQVLEETKSSRVDVVAHSMGGLVARSYIEGTDYGNEIDQLITMGTPHRGAPEAYLKWEAGEGFFDIEGFLLGRHLKHEAEENGYDELYKYIQEEIPTVKELLPDYDYLFDLEDDEMRSYPSDYSRNEFLESLNEEKNLSKIQKVRRFLNIIGKTGKENTTSSVRVTNKPENMNDEIWKHGYPEKFDDKKTDRGINLGTGDKTVPIFSAESIPYDKKLEIDSDHTSLPTKSQFKIFYELSGEDDDCDYIDDWDIPNWLLFHPYSPVDMQVISPSGKKIGKNFETGEFFDEMEGAYYTGYERDGEEIKEEFIVVPNPENGEYEVLTQGTGEGEYRVEVSRISEGQEGEEDKEAVGIINGSAAVGKIDEVIAIVSEDKIEIEEEDKLPPTINIIYPENKEYVKSGELGFEIEIEDNESDKENILVEKFLDSEIFNENTPYLSLLKTGSHEFGVKATDEAGNEAEENIEFNLTINIKVLRNNIEHYYDQGLIKTRQEKKMLLNHLRIIERQMDFHEKINDKKRFRLKKRTRKLLSRILERNIERHIDILVRKIERDKRNYGIIVKDIIIDDLEYIKINI
jgi:pimeloyl-ACP methyl ester carboxylesterase